MVEARQDMQRPSGRWRSLRRLTERLNPWGWLRRRREQSLICSLACVVEEATTRWAQTGECKIAMTADDYEHTKRRTQVDHAGRGLEYVGPFCEWDALVGFALSQTLPGPALCAVPGRDDKVWVRFTSAPDGRLVIGVEPAPGADWSVEGSTVRWARVTARPLQ